MPASLQSAAAAALPDEDAGGVRPSWLERLRLSLGTLKSRLTLAAVGCLVAGIGGVSAMSQHRIERDLLAQLRERELAHTARLAADLSHRAIALQKALRSTAEQIGPALESRDDALEQHLLAQPALLQEFANLFVVAPDGRMRVMIDEVGARRPRVSVGDRDYFRTVMAERRPVISGALPGRVSGEPVIVFAHPIVRDGQVTSVVGGGIRLSSRNLAAFVDDGGDAPTERLAISDEAGQVLAHPMRDLLLKPLSQDAQFAAALDDWVSRGSPVEPSGLLLQQPGVVATAAGVAGTGWVVWRSVSETTLLEPVRATRLETARDGALAIVVLGLCAYGVVWLQLRPLRQLQQRARHLFVPGIGVHQGWPTAGGEIGSVVLVLRRVGAERAHLESLTSDLLGQLNSVMAAAPLGIAFTRHQRFELVSKAWCRLLDKDEAELIGARAIDAFASEADYHALGPQVGEAFRQHGEYAGEWRFRRRDGSVFWGHLCGRPVDLHNADAGTIWTLSDVTDIRARREDLQWTATHDALTGLANRAAFDGRLRAVLGQMPASLLLIDLDHFKPINDSYGHAAGDAMLKRVAAELQQHVRVGDLVARLGGDEFGVLLEGCPPEIAHRVASGLQEAISKARLGWEGTELCVGASIGVAVLTEALSTIEAWYACADAACYAAKAAGRGVIRSAGGEGSRQLRLVAERTPRL